MRKFYTRLFLVVLMATLFVTTGYSQANVPPATLWPADNSTDQLLPTVVPGDQTLTITFAGATIERLNNGGIISLNAGPGGTGEFQTETLQIGVDAGIVLNGNTVEVTFQHVFVEDAYYFVTVSDDAIVLNGDPGDDYFFSGLGFSVGGSFDDNADWGFKVKDVTPPVMETCVSETIHNGERGVGVAENVVHICFSEPVYWVGGSVPSLNPGDIAFYHATNPDLDNGDPYGEFGGDVLYQEPYAVGFPSDFADDIQQGGFVNYFPMGQEILEIWVKYPEQIEIVEPPSGQYPAIGSDVWPVDADIYLRFLSGLIEDKDGNVWTGVEGSPWDPYSVSENMFWFTTRDDDAITVDVDDTADGNTSAASGHADGSNVGIWANEDFVISIQEVGLTWISNDAALAEANAADLLEVENNGTPIAFSIEDVWENSGITYIHIDPASPYSSGDVITVRVLGGLIWDADLVEVEEYEEDFTAGDFDAPVFSSSINNILCTNFDIRTWDADEVAQVWYAMIVDDTAAAHPGWNDNLVTIEDIYNGYMDVDDNGDVGTVGSDGYETRVYFNAIADPNITAPVFGNDATTHADWVADMFNIDPETWEVTFEHVDDFIAQNHGKVFRLFMFGFDQDADGPYAAGFETTNTGQATGVIKHVVDLTDCLPPEHTWHYEGVDEANNILWDSCGMGGNIKKQGRWAFKVPTEPEGLYVDELHFVNQSLSWSDIPGVIASGIFELEVATADAPSVWREVIIADIEYTNDMIIVTPLNSYPSAGWARITLKSGSIEDKHGNPINIAMTCTQPVESYCDPYIQTMTVDTKSLLFPAAPNHAGLNGVVALKDANIYIAFNNPLYIPKVDESNSPVLEPIGDADDVQNNFTIEEYIRIRKGTAYTAEDTLDVIDNENFNFTVFRDGNGGIDSVIVSPANGFEYESEWWYYVEVENTLQDENRRELSWDDGSDVWDNNIFVDPHHQYSPYTLDAGDVCEDTPSTPVGNSHNYFMRFRTEDKISPELMFTFDKLVPEPPVGTGPTPYPYITPVDEDMVPCVDYLGGPASPGGDGIPIGAIITEWSQMGFDDTDYFVEVDPNGLRDYFTLTNETTGEELDFDVVVLDIVDPDDASTFNDLYGLGYTDAVWFGFRPFDELVEGNTYSMLFDYSYQAPGSALDEGNVFVDDNGNPLVQDTWVEFSTCVDATPPCLPVTASIVEDQVITDTTPDITLTFDRIVEDYTGQNNCYSSPALTITGGGDTWELADAELFNYNDNNFTVTIPWESWLSDDCGAGSYDGPALVPGVQYTLTVNADMFTDRNNEDLGNCELVVDFMTADIVPPAVTCISPDIIDNTDCTGDNAGTYNLATAINPRNPGLLTICFDEAATFDGTKNVEIWEVTSNVNTLRWEFEGSEGTWNANSRTWTIEIPADELNFDSHFSVDVEAGFVVDAYGNEFPGINREQSGGDDCETWTFATGSDEDIYIMASTPQGTIDPYSAGYTVIGDSVLVEKITISLSEPAVKVPGAQVRIHSGNPVDMNFYQVNVSAFTPVSGSNNMVFEHTLPGDGVKVPYDDWMEIVVADSAFQANWGSNMKKTSMWDWTNNSDPANFRFLDNVAPTSTIWPVDGDTAVAFNAHGYVKFSESLIARNGGGDELVVSQQNLKSWIKVRRVVDLANGSTALAGYLSPSEYVCEFIDLARTRVRVTFLDENAPSISGVTANLIDQYRYEIEVNTMGDGVGDTSPTAANSNGFMLQDGAGNYLNSSSTASDFSAFDTEDITDPKFIVTTCDVTANSVDVAFTPTSNVNPWSPTVRTYNPEAGVAYYIVLPASATAPTISQLFNKTLAGVEEVVVPEGGTSVTVDLSGFEPIDVPPVGGYNFKVYAVMRDNEEDIFDAANNYGDAWIGDDPVFEVYGDWPTGIADIRPAPNKNEDDLMTWNVCLCDDDKPEVVAKSHHEDMNVPVDEVFYVDFDEQVAFGPDVNADGTGTAGIPLTDPNGEFGYEVRLRYWDNNIAVPITISLVNGDSTLAITPDSPLDEETRYYIEVDRFVIHDVPYSNCTATNPQLPVTPYCSSGDCGDSYNFYDGWVGRWDYWFVTNDNTPPVLVDVSPQGCCVDNENDEIVFTFTEKNGMQIQNLTSPSSSIYIYKAANHAIPFEIIPSSSGVIEHVSGNTWTITFPTQHVYNSEEWYEVEWNDGLFTDVALPVPHKYEIASALENTDTPHQVVDAEGVDSYCEEDMGVYDDGGDTGAPWDMFTFHSMDNIYPTINWAMVSTLWQGWEGHHEYVYQIPGAMGSWDINDPQPDVTHPVTINDCGTDIVPDKVAFYVWTSEDVTKTQSYLDMEDLFFLEVNDPVSGWSPVSIEVVHSGVNADAVSLYGEPGGILVDNNYWQIIPVSGELSGSSQYRFGIVGSTIEDTSYFECQPDNVLPRQELFNFCTWDTAAPVATLQDNCMVEGEEITKPSYTEANPMDTCVCLEYIDLCFDKVVVKTANDGGEPPVVAPGGSPWFNYTNLLMTEADLMDTDDGHFIDFREVGGDAVEIESVDVFLNGVNLADGQTCACGDGALCYRLYIKGGLDENTDYYFAVKDSVLKDQVRVPNGNIFEGQYWYFRTKFNTAPYIVDITPDDEQENVVSNAPLIVEFNREVIPGEGHIIVRDNGPNGGVVVNVPGTDPSVTISGNTATINHAVFADNTMFYVEVQDAFVYGKACDQMPFVGDIEQGLVNDYWNFRTGDVDGPVASLWPNQNPDDFTAACVAPVSDLVLTFDENIYFDGDCGELVIYRALNVNPDGSPVGSATGGAIYGDVVERIAFTEDNFPRLRLSGTDEANGLTRNQITVIPTNPFVSGETYYVRLEGNGVTCDSEANILEDILGNDWYYPVTSPLPGIHYNDWWFKIDNDAAPMLVSTSPIRQALLAANQDGTGVTTDLVMNFDMDVLAGSGKIQVWEFIVNPEGGVAAQQEYMWKEFDVEQAVADGDITIDGSMVTIHDVYLLDGIDWYYVIADPGTFTSTVPCILRQWEGIENPDVWLFSTDADVTCPALTDELVDSDAADEVYEDPSTVNFTLTFSESISIWNGWQLAQILDSEGEVVAEATITSDNINGNVLTLDITEFDAPLMDQSEYTLYIPSASIHDLGTNSVWGMNAPFGNVPHGNENFLCEDVEIPFSTGDWTAPEVVSVMPTETCLENEVTLVITFTEPVLDGDADITLIDVDGELDPIVLDAANDEDDVDETLTFTLNLPDETDWEVQVAEGAVTDVVYMEAADGPWPNVAADGFMLNIDDNTVPSLIAWETPGQDIDNLETSFDIVLTYDDDLTAVDVAEASLTVEGNTINNGITGAVLGPDADQVTVTVVGVDDQTAYMLVLGEGFVMDDACNENASVADEAGAFTVGDRTKPIIEDWAPEGILASYHTPPINVIVDFFDDSELTVMGPIWITNYDAEDNVISQVEWDPTLDAEQLASTMPDLWFGEVNVFIPEGTVADPNGNVNDEFEWSFWIVDNTPPGEDCLLSVTPADGDRGVLSTPDLVMEFCERMAACATVQYISVYELNSTGTNVPVAHIIVTDDMIDGTTVTIPLDETTIRPDYNIERPGTLKDGQDYIVMADAGSICDEAGNPWVGIDDPTVWNWTTGDNTPPTVVLVPANSVNDFNDIQVEAQFSEEVVGADTEIMVVGAESYTITMNAGNDVATIDIVALDSAEVTVTVPVTITDVADEKGYGNPLAEEVVGTYVVGDRTKPTVSYSAPADPQLNTFDVALTFSEPVMGVEDAITVTNATDVVVTGEDGDKVYTVTITADDEMAVGFVLDESVTDVSPNTNPLEAGLDLTFNVGDHVAPTYTVDPETLTAAKADFDITIEFSEEVVGVEDGITVTGDADWDLVAGADNTWTLSITNAVDESVITVDVAASITDGAPNFNPVEAGTFTYTIGDNTAPTVSVYKPSASDTINEFDVSITFSEVVTGVDLSTVTVTGITPIDPTIELTELIPGRSYVATLSGIDGDVITLGFTDGIEDLAGNALVPVTFDYSIANVAPTVMADPSEGVNMESGSHTVTLTFSEPVLNAETGIEVTGAVSPAVVAMVEEGVYEVVFIGDDLATIELTVTDAVTDLAGMPIVPVTFTYVIDDNTAPEIVSVEPVSDNATANEFTVSIVFSEPVYGVAEGIEVVGGTGMTVTYGEDGDEIYEVTLTGNDGDDIAMTITNAIVDGAGNPNPLAEEGTYYYTVGDNTGPTLTVTQLPDPQANEFTVRLEFNEPVNKVQNAGSIYIENGELVEVVRISASVYDVTISAEDEVTVTMSLSSNIVDLAGNEFAGASYDFVVGDWTAPVATGMTPSGLLDGDDTTFDLVLTLNEDVVAGAGNVVVTNADNSADVYTFDVSEVTIDGSTVTIPVSVDKFSTYYVMIDEGFVTDVAGNAFAGIADDVTWTFETNDFATPVIDWKDIDFKVYPNPFNDFINIDNADKLSRVVISNITGQSVIDVVNPGQVVRTPNLVSGAYLITLFTEEGIVKTERIVKR